MSESNMFYIWTRSMPAPQPLDPVEWRNGSLRPDAQYFCRVLVEVDRLIGTRGLRFVMTWHLDRFAPEMRDAVVMMIGDEMYQTPSFFGRVKTLFKTGGTRPNPLSQTLQLPPSIAARVLLRAIRNRLKAVSRHWKYRRAFGEASPVSIWSIPLGTYHLGDVPVKPIAERNTDVFFAGSCPDARQRTLRPSITARLQMFAALRKAEAAMSGRQFVYSKSQYTQHHYNPEQYTQHMSDAKIALCPRGNFDETFRLLEAAKSGCVIITEPLPPRWYYRDAPVITVRSWSKLLSTLQSLYAQPQRISELSQRTQQWWQRSLSEAAVAQYMVEHLETADSG